MQFIRPGFDTGAGEKPAAKPPAGTRHYAVLIRVSEEDALYADSCLKLEGSGQVNELLLEALEAATKRSVHYPLIRVYATSANLDLTNASTQQSEKAELVQRVNAKLKGKSDFEQEWHGNESIRPAGQVLVGSYAPSTGKVTLLRADKKTPKVFALNPILAASNPVQTYIRDGGKTYMVEKTEKANGIPKAKLFNEVTNSWEPAIAATKGK